MEEDNSKRKPHRTKKSGRKAEKKARKNEDTRAVSQAGMTAKQRNPKAFAVQNVTKLKKRVRRTLDIKEKKVHDPVVDRTPLEPPPIIVAVVGPPKVGKSTVLRGLIKNYTSQKLADIKGPVTVVSGKKRRLTFIECNNDMNSMIDIAKVADLVLLLIDASFGMEMETFEFLNICQVHGFPRIMGVLTHLDYFKNNKKLKTVRKTLKHRFWTEIYQGAKLFYLSGMVHGEYLKNEIHNLARFISVMKFRPLTWRNSHPYLLADRMEDITDPEHMSEESASDSDGDEMSGLDASSRLMEDEEQTEDHLSFDKESDEEAGSEDEEAGHLKWKENLVAKASQAFLDRQRTTPNLRKLVYDVDPDEEAEKRKNERDDIGGMFKVISKEQRTAIDNMDCTRTLITTARDWSTEEMKELIRDCFVTGEWETSKDAQKLLDEDDDLYGDFEDLEKDSEASDGEAEDGDESAGDESKEPVDGNTQKSKKLTKEDRKKKMEEKRLAKKQRVKEMFDAEYDKATNGDGPENLFDARKAELDIQAKLNRSEFDGMDDSLRVLYEGYRAGLYVRVEIRDMPCEFVENFDPSMPMVLGGMTSTESVIGCVQARFKKHRWYNKILKTKDPIIFSLGWRRFQSVPLYTVQDHNGRNRHLKYTPEHLHCNAIFWGPSTPQNTGLLCLQSYSPDQKGFRVCATGVVLSLDKSLAIMKKLKLIGYPLKTHKKTAFIKDMFSSQLEVAKFEGAKIKTVSGIRGQVKKALRTPEGAFRATFEDTILMSDIVFLKTWYQVELPKFYNPVTNLLMPTEIRTNWKGMKTVGVLRKELGVKAEFSQDSQYQKEAIRKKHHLKPLTIPKKLQRDLPFDYKPKVRGKFEDPVLSKRIAVVRDAQEKKRDQLINQMRTIQTATEIKAREDKQQRHRDYRKKKRAEEADKNKFRQKTRKELYMKLGKIKEKVHKRMNYNEADE